MKEYKFCPSCTTPLEKITPQMIECGGCDWIGYNNPKPVVAVLVPYFTENDFNVSESGLLMVKRDVEPMKGEWCLPCGYIDAFEEPRDAAERETLEESGVIIRKPVQVDIRNPRPGIENIITIGYLGLPAGGEPTAGDDAIEVKVYDKESIPRACFGSHQRMIERWYEGEYLHLLK